MGGQQVGRERERGQEVEVQQGPDAAPEVERAEQGQQGSEVTAAVHSKATPNSGLSSVRPGARPQAEHVSLSLLFLFLLARLAGPVDGHHHEEEEVSNNDTVPGLDTEILYNNAP